LLLSAVGACSFKWSIVGGLVLKKIITILLLITLISCLSFASVLAAPDGSGTAGNSSIPRVIVDSYTIGSEKVFGNDTFDLTFTLTNTGTTDINNLLLTLTSDNNAFPPAAGKSNQIYVGYIASKGKFTGKTQLKANGSLVSGTYNVNFAMQYQDVNNTSYLSAAQIGIALDQQQKLSINDITLPKTSLIGSKVLLNVSYKNPGKTDIKNLVLNLQGDIPESEKTVSIGTVAAGNSGYVDQYISPQSTGSEQISVFFTYEDSDGNAFSTAAQSVTILVESSGSAEVPVNVTTAPLDNFAIANISLNLLLLIILGICVVVAVVIIVVIVVIKKKKKAKRWDKIQNNKER
jgi:hypothetical protein